MLRKLGVTADLHGETVTLNVRLTLPLDRARILEAVLPSGPEASELKDCLRRCLELSGDSEPVSRTRPSVRALATQ